MPPAAAAAGLPDDDPDKLNLTPLLNLAEQPRELLLLRAGLASHDHLPLPAAAERLGLDSEQARLMTLHAMRDLTQGGQRPFLNSDSPARLLYATLIKRIYGEEAPLLLGPLVAEALTILPARDRLVLLMRSGLGGLGRHTQRETGDLLWISSERVRVLQERALRCLRYAPEGLPVWVMLMERIYLRMDHPSHHAGDNLLDQTG